MPTQRALGDRQVIAHEVELRELRLLREVRLARVGDADLAPVDRRGPRLPLSCPRRRGYISARGRHEARRPRHAPRARRADHPRRGGPAVLPRARVRERRASHRGAGDRPRQAHGKELQKIEGIGKSTADEDPRAARDGQGREARGAARRSTRRASSRSCASRGSGPRRCNRLRAELGVQSIDDLRACARRARGCAALKGFGAEVGGEARAVAGAARRARVARSHADLGRAAARRSASSRDCSRCPA